MKKSAIQINFGGLFHIQRHFLSTSRRQACLFPAEQSYEEIRCATLGVFAPLVGIIGAMQAAEALKLLAGIGTALAGRLLLLDARTMTWSGIGIGRDVQCRVCSG